MLFQYTLYFWPNTVSKYQTWTNSYLFPSNAEMQRELPGDPGAGTSSYWVMPSNTATKISTIFRDRVITELIYLLISAAMVSMMFRRLIWIHFFYHFLAIRLYHEFLSQLNCHFDIAFFEHYLLQTTTAAKQANEILWNFYLPTLKHLVIQLAKLQIYTSNLTTTFWHCKKNSITFEQECTTGFHMNHYWIKSYTIQCVGSMLMMTSSNGNIFRVTGHLCGEFTGPRWIPHTKASDAELWWFILICVCINDWVNDREAGDLIRYCAHYDVIVMSNKLRCKGIQAMWIPYPCNV